MSDGSVILTEIEGKRVVRVSPDGKKRDEGRGLTPGDLQRVLWDLHRTGAVVRHPDRGAEVSRGRGGRSNPMKARTVGIEGQGESTGRLIERQATSNPARTGAEEASLLL